MGENNNTELARLLRFILNNRRSNLLIFTMLTILALIFVFFVIPKQYSAEISILPHTSATSQALGGKLGTLASLAGVNMGSSTVRSPEMYLGIIKSRELLKEVAQKKFIYSTADTTTEGNLISFFEVDEETEENSLQKTIEILREDVIAINIDDHNQILYLNVTLENPELAAKVANYTIEVLEGLVFNKLEKEINDQLNYLNRRLSETNDSLKIAEENLKRLLETTIDPTRPDFQIAQLKIRRHLEIQSAIYIEFKKQMELVTLDNFVTLSPIKILDMAYPPYKKSRPKRLFVLATIMLLFGFIQLGANWLFASYDNIKTFIDVDETMSEGSANP